MNTGDPDLPTEQPAERGQHHADLVAVQRQPVPRTQHAHDSEEHGKTEPVSDEEQGCTGGVHPVRMADVSADHDPREVSEYPIPVHDLGGRPGFGPVPVHDDVLFHADWERRAFAVTQFSQRAAGFNTDAFRHGIERENPSTYLAPTYFEKWIRNAERMLVEGGVVTAAEIDARLGGLTVDGGAPQRTTDATPPVGRGTLRNVESAPRFTVGDEIRVSATYRAPGHTRLPEYVRGCVGTIIMLNDGWIFPDTHAHGEGEQPTWVYAVSFDSDVLWPETVTAHRHQVVVDLFEPYLEQP